MNEEIEADLGAFAKHLADQGRLLEAGWLGYRSRVAPPQASVTQIEETRRAFMAGAHHLFSSLLMVLDPGASEPTPQDMQKMALIEHELHAFALEVKRGKG